MAKEQIFIHIPKTGGTTLIAAIRGLNWMPKPDFHYRHIIYDSKKSNSGDIFKKENFEKYAGYDIFSIIRHPVDRLISEYYFIRDRQEFMALFRKKPKNLKEYALNPQTQNYMVSFFLGGRMFRKDPINQGHLDLVIDRIDSLPIHVGIFEEYEKSMSYLSSEMGVKFPKKIEVKRVTLNRPALSEVDEETKAIIIDSNKLDMQLYNHCLKKLESENVRGQKVSFSKDRYDYIMKYTQRFELFELFMDDKSFISRNKQFFRDLNMALHERMGRKEGKRYVDSWNQSMLKFITMAMPDFNNRFDFDFDAYKADPLSTTKLIAMELEEFLKNNKLQASKLLKYKSDKVYIADRITEKKSIIKKLFG